MVSENCSTVSKRGILLIPVTGKQDSAFNRATYMSVVQHVTLKI